MVTEQISNSVLLSTLDYMALAHRPLGMQPMVALQTHVMAVF